jgi:aspartyl-tRNA(Asn)/glutamyl-tRNA(Gln) amidotransferase subunit B
VRRQIELIEDGGKVVQETVLYDPDRGETRSMRSKEDAHDYRYFPDPDLLPLVIDEDWIERVKASCPSCPRPCASASSASYGLSAYDAAGLTASRELAAYFDRHARAGRRANAKPAPTGCRASSRRSLNREEKSIAEAPGRATALAGLMASASPTARSPARWPRRSSKPCGPSEGDGRRHHRGQGPQADHRLRRHRGIIDEVLAANPKSVEEFRAGKEKAFNALVGQVMKATKGKANPAQVNDLLKKLAG